MYQRQKQQVSNSLNEIHKIRWIRFAVGSLDCYDGQYIGEVSVDSQPIYQLSVGR